MRTFFGLSMADYGKPFEKKNLGIIENNLGELDILSASEINKRITEEDKKKGFRFIEENYFFKEIDNSDIVIGTYNARSRQFTIGVIVEMEYALMQGKRVYELDLYGLEGGDNDSDFEEFANGFNIKKENLIELDIQSGIGRHYSDIVYRIPGLETIRIKDRYKELMEDKWWLK